MNLRINWLGAILLLFGAAVTSTLLVATGMFEGRRAGETSLSDEELTGSIFLARPRDPFRAPRARELSLPNFENDSSIWGSTGQDISGQICFGVSASAKGKSAHLVQCNPDSTECYDRGDVAVKLREVGLYSEGEGQVKIHSRIVPAGDGWLYFASTDEEGEDAASNIPPRWGGHLWRIHPQEHTWQHMLAVREGLVAVSGGRRYVYALGYWGHILFQYDIETGRAKRVTVGSTGGHVSRNFLSDVRGYAYVPRVTSTAAGKNSVALVEYDPNLNEVGTTPLEHYLGDGTVDANHGVIGVAYLQDGRMLFATHVGHLYSIEPRQNDRAVVRPIGWLHREGPAYTPSLFSVDGSSLIAGLARRSPGFEWVVASPENGVASAFPLQLGNLQRVLLYGSITRDNAGRFYVAGWGEDEKGAGRQGPLALQISADQ